MADTKDICHELDALEVDNFENQAFIPLDRLETLLTRERISHLIHDSQVRFYDRQEAIRAILQKGLKVFATLASIREIGAISKFIESDQSSDGFLDARLPLEVPALDVIFSDKDVRSKFYRKQWRFLAPVLQADQSYRKYHEKTILPFISSKDVTSGGYGDVSRVTIDTAHHAISHNSAKVAIPITQYLSCIAAE